MDSLFLDHAATRLPDSSVSMLLVGPPPPPPDRRESIFLVRALDRVLELMKVCHWHPVTLTRHVFLPHPPRL